MTELLKGKAVADALLTQIEKQVAELSVTPTLAIVRVGKKPDDLYYEQSALKQAKKTRVRVKSCAYEESVTQSELVSEIERINNDKNIHGVLILRPLPSHIDDCIIRETLTPQKDIDGITGGSLAGILLGENLGFPPCTARACMEILSYYNVALSGKKVTVLGRSLVVGKPVAMMTMNENATVTVCHSKTPREDLIKASREAHILIVAMGKASAIGADHVSSGQTVIDVGINVSGDGKFCGDVDFEAVESLVDSITPVPGGVGTVTVAVLMKQVVEAAKILEYNETY